MADHDTDVLDWQLAIRWRLRRTGELHFLTVRQRRLRVIDRAIRSCSGLYRSTDAASPDHCLRICRETGQRDGQ